MTEQRNEKQIFKLKIHKVLLILLLFGLLCFLLGVNVRYYLNMSDLKISLFPKWPHSFAVTNAIFLVLMVMIIWLEMLQKWLYVKIISSDAIEIISLRGKFILKRQAESILVTKILYSRSGEGRVIALREGKAKFQISEFYLSRFNTLEMILFSNGFLNNPAR